MSSSRAGGGSGSAAIPANARKTVQSLKEIVPNSEDEIYAVLKECNMDPNETVQRLLNQDPFHEVKRKRDKKKEWNKESSDGKVRPANGGTQSRGGRGGNLDRGSSRGGQSARHAPHDFSGGRGKSGFARENGAVNTSSRVANTVGGPSLSAVPSQGQGRTQPSGMSNPSVPPATSNATPPGVQNGSPGFVRPASVSHGSWGASASGHATMADIVKANGAPVPAPVLTPVLSTSSTGAPIATAVAQQFLIPGSASLPVSSGVYSSSTDPVLHPSLDTRASGTSGAIKREIGTVGNQRTKVDWPPSSLTMDSLSASAITSQSLQSMQTSTTAPVIAVSLDGDTQATRPTTPPVSVSPPSLQERPASHSVADTGTAVGTQSRHGAVTSSSGALGSRPTVVCGPFSSRPVYLSQQHPVGTQKAAGAALEWKPKLVVQSTGSMGAVNTPSPPEPVRPSSPSTVSGDSGAVSAATSKLHGISIHGDQPVIIPNHLQVAEAEQTHLSFGSFAAGFGTSFSASFVSEDTNKLTSSAEGTSVIETPIEQSNTVGAVIAAPATTLGQSYVHQSISAPEEILAVTSEIPRVSLAPATVLQSDVPKPDPVPQGPHYPYLPTIPNYPGFNVLQQVPVGQYAYESSDTQQSQPPDVSRLPNLVPYTDPASSYYTPIFRPGSEGDARYPSFVTSNTSNKYNGNMGLLNLAGQSLASPESGNSALPPVPAAQTSQTGNGQTIPTMSQQPLPLHAYAGQPTGAPLGPHYAFGYQYMPGYAYMPAHPPYQHNYTTSSVYPQGPTGSNYPAAASSTYPPGGATAVKYQLPYKPGNATGITPHSATGAGYGGYGAAPTGYATNPTVTVGNTAGYEDVSVPQYKDNLYIPSQQVEGSTVWIQTQMSRDMAVGGMQTSSYYNMPGQGQHGAYAHAQPPSLAHTHPGYANLYHPSQSGQAQATHQLLQQPQALGAGGGSQTGGYQQPQRTQQTWTSNY